MNEALAQIDALFPRLRDKALFAALFLAGPSGWQAAFALTHRNRKWL